LIGGHTMILEAELSVPGPPHAVFDALVDARRAADAVPGARLTEPPAEALGGLGDEPGFGAELRLQAGGSQITYRGRVLPTEADRTTGTLSCSLDGREVRGAGVLRGRLRLRLDPAGEDTRLRVDADLEITGRAERLGEERLREAALRLLHRVATRLGEGTEVTAAAARPQAESVVTLGALEPEPRVAGEVRLVTRQPVPLSTLPVSGGRLDDLRVELRRRPWAVALLVVVAVLLVVGLRHRRD
jgi:carbon monoxide dehydrogenase subunit G